MGKSRETERRLVTRGRGMGAQGKSGRGGAGRTTDGDISLWGDENVLDLVVLVA